MRITRCRMCDNLCANWSRTAGCGSCTSSRTCDQKASWTSLSDSRGINDASRSNTNPAQACTRGSSCWAARMLWYAIAVWTCTSRSEEERAEHNRAEFCTLRCTAISMLLTRTANAPVSAPVTPPVRGQGGRPAPSTPEKLPERGPRQGVAHSRGPKARVAPQENELMNTRECFQRDLLSRSFCVAACLLETSREVRLRSVQTGPASSAPERVAEARSKGNVVRVAPRTTEVKQQQDWRLVFVDRPETYQITDCGELMVENVGFDRDLLFRCICEAGGLSVASHEVRLRKVQTGPDLGCASLAQRVADEEVPSDSECSLCPGDDQKCRCCQEGMQARSRGREVRRACLCSLQDGMRPICQVALQFGDPSLITNAARWLPAPSPEQGGRCNDRKKALAYSC